MKRSVDTQGVMFSAEAPQLSPLKRMAFAIKPCLPELNWRTIHWAYFIFTCLFSGILLWVTATPFRSLTFTDALFLATSAMTEAGLNTVNLSTLNTFQHIVLFVLIMIGSTIFVSASIIFARVKAFEKEFAVIIQRQREQKQKRRMTVTSRLHSRSLTSTATFGISPVDLSTIERRDQVSEDLEPIPAPEAVPSSHERRRIRGSISISPGIPIQVVIPSGNSPDHIELHYSIPDDYAVFTENTKYKKPRPRPNTPQACRNERQSSHSPAGPVGRNYPFHGLSFSERQRLGGYEYRAVVFLSFLVPIYFVLWQLLGCLSCGAWVAYHRATTTLDNGMNPWWVGAFNAVSAFNNSGMSLLDANMVDHAASPRL